MAPTALEREDKILTIGFRPYRVSDSSSSPSPSLTHSNRTGLFTVPGTHQACTHLRAFACAILLAGKLSRQIMARLTHSFHSGLCSNVPSSERRFLIPRYPQFSYPAYCFPFNVLRHRTHSIFVELCALLSLSDSSSRVWSVRAGILSMGIWLYLQCLEQCLMLSLDQRHLGVGERRDTAGEAALGGCEEPGIKQSWIQIPAQQLTSM